MRKITTAFVVALLLSQAVGCDSTEKVAPKSKEATPAIPAMTDAEKQAAILSPEVMLKMRRLGGAALSPDGATMVYSVGVQDIENNGSYSNLYAMNTATKEEKELTSGTNKNFDASWSADGKTIYFISTSNNGAQLWSMNSDGTNAVQVSDVVDGIGGYSVSPKGDKVFYIKSVKVDKTRADMYPNQPKSNARIYDDLMVRHWDYWTEGVYQHPFVADLVNGKLANDKDIIEGEAWDVPTAPYFDVTELSWSNAGDKIAYTAKKEGGKTYALSTNSDIFVYNVADGSTKNITEGMPGYDKYPVFSADDSKIAFSSMRRAGNEADKTRLMVWDSATGEMSYLTESFDYNSSNYVWDGNAIYFIAPIKATQQICRVDVTGEKAGVVEVLTDTEGTLGSILLGKDKIYSDYQTISSSSEIVALDRTTNEITPMTDLNKDIYANVKMGEVQKRWIKTSDGKEMLTWVVLPPNFDATKKYPTLLYCEGGPQSTVNNGWSFRWNFQLMAAQGYVVVAPNRRGLPSFGQEWLDQISGDYSGQNIKDYFAAIDEVSKEPWVDKENRGCVGASYGGYSVYFIAGHHQKRFKALISHCGMFNFESFYGSTEELWFPTNDLGGSYFSDNATAKRSYANSPHKFVKKWDTPILIITGEKDYRIPYTQSLEAFTAARLMDIDARLLSFPDEAHQVFKPQNALIWHSEFFGWLNKYLKK